MAVLLSAFVTLFLLLFVSAGGTDSDHASPVPSNTTPFTIKVTNSLKPGPNTFYQTYVVYRGILLGGMKRLQQTNKHFKFIYTEDPNYGPFLQSVNGLAGDLKKRTYWEFQVKKPNGAVITPDIGIGCYIPSANDTIIFKYSSY